MNSSFARIARAGLAALAVVCLVAPGCKSNGNADLLERELRLQEDRIYELENELDNLCAALDSARRENQALKREGSPTPAGGSSSGSSGPRLTLPPSISTPTLSTPKIDAPQIELPSMSPDLQLPPGSSRPDPNEAPPLFQPSGEPATEGDSTKRASALEIDKIVLNRRLTAGWNPDGKPGDEGVFVGFETRDAAGQPIQAVGDVSIVLLDPGRSGASQRLARWDFDSYEAAEHYNKGPLAKGYQFELPWSSDPPSQSDLKLFVRVTKPDGTQLEASTTIHVEPPVANSNAWSPKAIATSRIPEGARPAAAIAQPAQPQRAARRADWSPNR